MISGFSDSAVIIYPYYEDYGDKGASYKEHIHRGSDILISYLRKCGIKADCFVTDDVARMVPASPSRWLHTLNRGDMFFARNNCDGMDMEFEPSVVFEDVYDATAEKFPIPVKASVDRRFEVMLKRDGMARRLIMKKYKMVFGFRQPKNDSVRFKTKPNSGILYTEIDNTSFRVNSWMGDMSMDTTDLFGVKNAYMPLYEWEVDA